MSGKMNREEVLDILAEALLSRREKAAAGVFTAQRLHGLGGLFNLPAEREVITAMVRPRGIGAVLPKIPSFYEDPTFESITGYTASVGAQPTNACAAAPYTHIKGCRLTARFGLKRFDTKEIEMDKTMLLLNRGDRRDYILAGRLLGMSGNYPAGIDESNVVNVMTAQEMVGVGVQMERALNIDDWQGTVAAGSYPGLDFQIATGQVDADTNTACPALDSDVKSFAYNDICGTGLDIVEYISMMAYYLQWNAESMGLDPVQWAIVMRPPLWYELTACWPCKYNTNRCLSTFNVAGDTVVSVDGRENIRDRDYFRRNMVLPVNGIDYPVILDTGIFEHTPTTNANLTPGQFASSIYFVPLTILGGMPVTYREYLDYRGAEPDRRYLDNRQEWWWTDAGMFTWAITQINWCYVLALKTEQRVILRTPHLAGKIQHVRYTPLQHLREPEPDSPYWADGGVSIRGTGTRYHVWN